MEEVSFLQQLSFIVEIWSWSLTNQLPHSWLARFQLTGQPDTKGQSQVIWRSHGQFDLETCPVQYPWPNSLARIEYEFAKCQPGPFFSCFWPTSGQCDITKSKCVRACVANTLQYMARHKRKAPSVQDNVISGYCWITFHNQAKVRT